MNDKDLLILEKNGEIAAAAHYRKSAEQATDPKIKELFLHIAQEEEGHAVELTNTIFGLSDMKNTMPKKKVGESESEFFSRFMADSEMLKDYPDEKQRAAVAYSLFRGEHLNSFQSPEDRRKAGSEAFGSRTKN